MIKMKKIIIILITISIIPAIGLSQDIQLKKLFTSYEDERGFSLEKSTSEMNIDMEKHSDFTNLLNNIKEIYIMNIDEDEMGSQVEERFKKEITKLIDKNGYNYLMDINNDGVFKMLVKRDNENKPTDIIIINQGDDGSMYLWATQ